MFSPIYYLRIGLAISLTLSLQSCFVHSRQYNTN